MTTARLGFEIDSSQAKAAAVDLDKLTAASQRTEAGAKKARDEFGRFSKAGEAVARANDNAASASSRLAEAMRQITAAESRSAPAAYAKRADDIAAYSKELDRLRARYDPLFAASKKYEEELNDLNHALSVGAINTQTYEAALERLNNIYSQYAGRLNIVEALRQANDNITNSIQNVTAAERARATAFVNSISAMQAATAATGAITIGQADLPSSNAAARSADIAAYANELDRLRAKFNPLFAASKAYEDELNDLNRAHQVGAITAREQEAALEALNARYAAMSGAVQSATGMVDRHNKASRMASHNARQLSFQLIDIGQAIPLAFQSPLYAMQNFGFQIAQIGQQYAGQGGLNAALRDSVGMIGRFTAGMGPAIAVVGAAAIGIAGLTHEINQSSDVAVSFGDTALAVFQLVRDGVYEIMAPAIAAIAPYFEAAWDGAVAATKWAINYNARAVIGGVEIITAAVGAIPDAFIVAGEAAANGFLSAIEYMVRETVAGINGLISSMNGITRDFGFETPMLPPPTSISLGRVDLGGAAAGARISGDFEGLMGRLQEIAGTDYAGALFDALSERAQQNAMAGALGDVGSAAGGAGKALKNAAETAKPEWDALSDTIKGARDVVGGFVQDLRQGLMDGESFWESFRNAAVNAIDKIVDRIINGLLDSLFQVGSASSGLGGGGLFGGLLGGLGRILGFASGGYTGDRATSAVAGVVHGQEFVVNANATRAYRPLLEAINGRGGGSASRGYAMGGYVAPANQNLSQANDNLHITVGVSADSNGNLMPFVESVSQRQATAVTQAGISAYDKRAQRQMGQRMAQAQERQL